MIGETSKNTATSQVTPTLRTSQRAPRTARS
jgi:hypothetical protein